MDNDYIPRLVWERDQARSSHTIKTLVRLMVLMLISLVVTVTAFLIYIHQKDKEWLDFLSEYDVENYDYTQDGKGVNIIGDSNGVDYYGAEASGTENDSEERQG